MVALVGCGRLKDLHFFAGGRGTEEVPDIAQICHGLDIVSLRMGGENKLTCSRGFAGCPDWVSLERDRVIRAWK